MYLEERVFGWEGSGVCEGFKKFIRHNNKILILWVEKMVAS